ncbi:glycoside hydrolase [Aspergillus eucalypticola CBS 122712]|uniref:glucan 1,3-beta-glucosidase n=1 Tax=Aspergillus eucalypticola (strain CBS 122712 / IBT 29274) TaxID=1448314 RepID=A0A317UWH7_ASPEC|nr:glycoside hydrolase [Aspergillus eucalypticola CBS 122712]PWY64330.1 glycoside hydrolase [Aspergillus eucalypticola CBS 122712]
MVNLLSAFFHQADLALAAAEYLNWTTYSANEVNLGGWLEQESTIDTTWWAEYSKGADDEWSLCVHQGSQCGPVLERRYATYITTSDIDNVVYAGVNLLRIPTTYASWVKVPGSQLYSRDQVSFLNNIETYAILKHSMHVIIDVHSLPSGVNGMAIGEATGHYGWFNNQTALNYSLQAIDSVTTYIQNSNHPESFTISPIDEPVDNTDLSAFGSASWVLKYIQAVLDRVGKVNPNIPVMFQGSFRGEEYWSSKFSPSANLVFDVHNYYFAGRGATGQNITTYICADAEDGAEEALNTGLYAFAKYSQGSAYYTAAKFSGNATVDGQGTQADYWNYMTWINNDMIHPDKASEMCA